MEGAGQTNEENEVAFRDESNDEAMDQAISIEPDPMVHLTQMTFRSTDVPMEVDQDTDDSIAHLRQRLELMTTKKMYYAPGNTNLSVTENAVAENNVSSSNMQTPQEQGEISNPSLDGS